MKTINLTLALIAIRILSINDDTNTVDLQFGWAEPDKDGKAKKWHNMELKNVWATGLALFKLKDSNNEEVIVNHTYKSINNSQSRLENPFALKRKYRINSDGVGEEYFTLSLVEQNGSYVTNGTLPDGTTTRTRVWKQFKKPFNYRRYIDRYDKMKEYADKQAQAETA